MGANLSNFCSVSPDLARTTTKSDPDFTIKDGQPDTFSRRFRSLVTYIPQRLIMIPLYPAQSNLLKKFVKQLNPKSLNELRPYLQGVMKSATLREVTIERNGIRYDALLMGRPETLQNGRWVLQATGNACPIEKMAYACWRTYSPAGFNVLMVNGPSVGRSSGHANARTIGEAQEGGIRFLETAIKAKQIALAGHSLGGAAIGQAILQHEFKKDISYLVVRQHAFDRTSNVVKKIINLPILKHIAQYLIYWADLEMDNVQSSKKLQELGIHEVIIQAVDPQAIAAKQRLKEKIFMSDGVIPAKASLGYRLVKEGVIQNKEFACIPNADHNDGEFLLVTREAMQAHFSTASLKSLGEKGLQKIALPR